MADFPLPSFATFEKLSGWAGEQATIFWRILAGGPADIVRQEVAGSGPERIKPALSFLAFVIAICCLTSTPLVFVFFGLNIFDFRIALCALLPMIIAVVVFTGSAHLAAVALRGRGSLLETAAGLFYGAAYLPFVYALHYLLTMDSDFRDWLRAGDETAPVPLNMLTIAAAALSLVLTVFIVVKLAGVIRVVHGMGWFRSTLVVLVAGALYQIYEALVWMPFFARVIAMKT